MPMITPPNTGLGKVAMSKGRELVRFKDALNVPCVVQSVTLAYSENGLGIAIGAEKAKPKLQARDAKALGIKTVQKTGFVAFPVPDEVSFDTRAVLSFDQVRELIRHLEAFVGVGRLTPLPIAVPMTAKEAAAADRYIEESLVGAKRFGSGVILPGGPTKVYTETKAAANQETQLQQEWEIAHGQSVEKSAAVDIEPDVCESCPKLSEEVQNGG